MSNNDLKLRQNEIIDRLNELGIEVKKDPKSVRESLKSYVIGRDRRTISINISNN